MLGDLIDKANHRPLINIEKRMKRKIEANLKRNGISKSELMNNKNWKLGGKDFRSILKYLDIEGSYSYGFGTSSHHIHGDWLDIYFHHLTREGRYYKPKLNFGDPDPRIACPLTSFCLERALRYIEWNHSDPQELVSPVIKKLIELNREIDSAHESTLGE